MADATESRALRTLADIVESGRPLAYIHSAEEQRVTALLRDVYELCLDRAKFVIICSPVKFIPEELARSIVYVELAVPDLRELVGFLRREAAAITAAGGSLDADEATLLQLARALQGLTLDEARHAIR